jgi:hypothetical protein
MKNVTWLELLQPREMSTYFPVTILTYRMDRVLFASWMPNHFADWAPGVRIHTWLYHALAALVVWRLFLRLGASRNGALFIALAFAVHPMACETVCWAAERKNALAGLFGFLSVWALVALEGRGRLLVVSVFYTLALLSKPSALGLLPLIAYIDWAGGSKWFREPSGNASALRSRLIKSLPLMIPLTILSIIIIFINMVGHAATIVPPPGGSLFSALLTDVEILARYLWNAIAPFQLSFSYDIEPIVSLLDGRLWLYGLLLLMVVSGSIHVAQNRRRALLGWIWFVVALSPQLNIVSLVQVMQDRYLYLSMPGLFLVIYEAAAGIASRRWQLRRPILAIASAWILLLAVLAFQRSWLFNQSHWLFADALEKFPQSAHAISWMSMTFTAAYDIARLNPHADPAELKRLRQRQGEYALAFMKCPDRFRQPNYTDRAVEAGIFMMEERQDVAAAEHFFQLVVAGLPHFPDYPNNKGAALLNLAGLRLAKNRAREAYNFATEAVVQLPGSVQTHFVRACAALILLEQGVDDLESVRLRDQARGDLALLKSDHPAYNQARKMLDRLNERP